MIPLLLTATLAVPASPGDLRATAEAEYRAGLEARDDSAKARPRFLRSAEAYEQLWEGGQRSPEIARNMAQARFLSGDLGRAIRDYRRGLRRSPHNPELQHGLDFMRSQVAYPSSESVSAMRPSDFASVFDRITAPFWSLGLAAIVVSAVGWFLLVRAWLTARGGLALVGGIFVLAAAITGVWLLWEDHRVRSQWAQPTAVVIIPTDLRSGNSEEYPKRVDDRLPVGLEARVLGRRGGWLHIELAGGAAGWIPQQFAAEVD